MENKIATAVEIAQSLDDLRLRIESDCQGFIAFADKYCDSILFLQDADGAVVGGKLWTTYDRDFSYCVTETHLYTVHGDAVVASELFTDEVQECLCSFFMAKSRGNQ